MWLRWLRFLSSGWYEILVGTLLVIALGLAFYVYGPQFGTGIDRMLGWIGSLQLEYQVLAGLGIFILLIWAGVHQLNLLLRIER